jgi:hypothetical protein
MKRRRTLLIAVAITVSATILFTLLRPASGPKFENKALSVWLVELNSGPPASRVRAAEAIKQIGTNAIPFLVAALSQTDSTFKRALLDISVRLPFPSLRPESADERRLLALAGFRVLGSGAKPALPSLEKLLEEKRNTGSVAMVLGSIGSNALPVLLKAIQSTNASVRLCAAAAISLMGSEAESAIPFLISKLDDPDVGVAIYSARTLGKIDSPLAIEALIGGLQNSSSEKRGWISEALGNAGARAVSAIPSLEKVASSDSNKWVRWKASEAIQSIAPVAAKPTNP